jgi:hypothetical protein
LRAKAGKGGISMARFFAYFFINEKSTSLPGLRAKEPITLTANLSSIYAAMLLEVLHDWPDWLL